MLSRPAEVAMTSHTKLILTLSSLGLGAALALTAAYIKSDRFAFTSLDPGNSGVLTELKVQAMSAPVAIFTDEVSAQLQMPQAVPEKARSAGPQRPDQAAKKTAPAEPPCKPEWRELESGPAGKLVREIC
jgi:hypothetical protein